MEKIKVAICAVGYNRVDSMKKLCNSLSRAMYTHNVDLIISIDNSGKYDVKEYADTFVWKYGNKRVIYQEKNLGLRKHILTCGGYMVEYEYDAIVVLEDDVTVAPAFMHFIDQCLDRYINDERIAGISLYNFPVNYHNRLPFEPMRGDWDVYFMNCAMSWGQVWMKKQWLSFMEWYKVNSEEFSYNHLPQSINKWKSKSWLKYHTRYCIEENKYFVFPYYSLSTNNCDVGTHASKKGGLFQSYLQYSLVNQYRLPSVDECDIKYDGFFESKFLYTILNINEDELCVDFYGEKHPSLYKQYLISSKALPFKVVKTWDLAHHPYEMNIVMNSSGSGIFLYETFSSDLNSKMIDNLKKYNYFYGDSLNKLYSLLGMNVFLRYVVKHVFLRLQTKLLNTLRKHG